jgi:hypothetical protein
MHSRREWIAAALLAASRSTAQAAARGRLMGDPQLWKSRAAAIPASIWKPRGKKPYVTETPNPAGNSGSAGVALLELTGCWLATGDDFYADDAIRVMLATTQYPHWGGFNHLAPDIDLDAGDLLMGVGVAYETLRERMGDAGRAAVRDKMVLQGRLMYAAFTRRRTIPWEQNHTYIDIGGLWCTAVALLDEVPEARAWYDFGLRVVHNAIYLLNSGDGAFYEGIGYWSYGVAMHLVQLLDLVRSVTGIDTFSQFDSLRLEKYYLLHVLMPGGKYWLNVGDVADSTIAPAKLNHARKIMMKLAREYRDPECQWLAEYFARVGEIKPSSDPWMLAWFDPSVKARDPRDSWPSYHHFKDLDLVMLRSDWGDDATHLALRCGPAPGVRATKIFLSGEMKDWKPGTGHVHPDLNSFTLFDHGEHLVVDTGYTEKKLTVEHNTITLDGAGQIGDGQQWPAYIPWNRFGRIGTCFGAPPVCFYVRGEAANGYETSLELQRFDRHLLLIPDEKFTYLLVDDRMEVAKPHQFEWLLHSNEAAVKVGANTFRLSSGSRVATVHMLLPERLEPKIEPVRVTPYVHKDSTAPRGYRLGLSPEPAANCRFLAVLTLHDRGGEGPGITFDGGAIRVFGGAWSDTITLDAAGGHHAMVRRKASDIVRWCAFDAKHLESDGQTLCTSSHPISAAWDASRQTLEYELAEGADVSVQVGSQMVRFRGLAGRHSWTLRRPDAG